MGSIKLITATLELRFKRTGSHLAGTPERLEIRGFKAWINEKCTFLAHGICWFQLPKIAHSFSRNLYFADWWRCAYERYLQLSVSLGLHCSQRNVLPPRQIDKARHFHCRRHRHPKTRPYQPEIARLAEWGPFPRGFLLFAAQRDLLCILQSFGLKRKSHRWHTYCPISEIT